MSSDAVEALNAALAARFGNRFTASEAIRKAHGHTLTWLENQPPDAVVFAETKDDVIDAVKLCAEHDAPIVPFGAGTSLEGHVNAPHGGVSLDCSRMNAVLAVNAADLDCVVEPGVTRKQLNEPLRDSGLFFPIAHRAHQSLVGMCALSVRAFNTYAKLSLPESPMLLVEFHGTEQSVAEQAGRFGEIVADHGGGNFIWATKPEERTKLWQARHDGFWAQMTLRPGARPFATDTCVPISRLADCVEETLADIASSGLVAPIVGHVGDGNFHVSPLIDMANPVEIETAEAF